MLETVILVNKKKSIHKSQNEITSCLFIKYIIQELFNFSYCYA